MAKVIDIRSKLPRHPTRKWKKRPVPTKIVVHTTASSNQDPFATARYHVTPGPQNHISTLGAPAIVYHDFITKDGTVYHCNDYEDWTWHAQSFNRSSIGVTMAYKAQTGEEPAAAQYLVMIEHVVVLCLYFKILPKNVYGHREIPEMWTLLGNGSKKYKKLCPGKSINLDKMRLEITMRLQRRLASEGLYKGAIDGKFGPQSQAALKLFDPLNNSRT